MDVPTRFFAVAIVVSTSLDESVQGFTAAWLSHFWIPNSVLGDKAFATGNFRAMLNKYGVKFSPFPLVGTARIRSRANMESFGAFF